MRKFIFLIFTTVFLVACGSSSDDNLSLSDYESAFEEAGFVVDDEKPMYELIGAKDGFIIHDGGKVAVYEFESEKDIADVEEALPDAKDWPKNGRFLLETSVEEAEKIFNNVK